MRTINHVSQGDIAKATATLKHPELAPRLVRSILTEAEAYDLLQEDLHGHEDAGWTPEKDDEERAWAEIDRNFDPEIFYGATAR